MKIPFMALACYGAAIILLGLAVVSLIENDFGAFYVIMAAIVGLGGAYIHGPGKKD